MRKQPNRKWKDVSRKRRINKQNKKEIRTFVTNPVPSTGTNVDPTPQTFPECGYGETPCFVPNPISTRTGGFWRCCVMSDVANQWGGTLSCTGYCLSNSGNHYPCDSNCGCSSYTNLPNPDMVVGNYCETTTGNSDTAGSENRGSR